MIISFIVSQLFPISVLGFIGKLSYPLLWISFELVIIGALLIWEIKPIHELDERELTITLKWKSRMIDYGSSVFLIPLVTVCLKPEIEAWFLYCIAAIPAYIAFVFCSVMAKIELGYFFIEEKS